MNETTDVRGLIHSGANGRLQCLMTENSSNPIGFLLLLEALKNDASATRQRLYSESNDLYDSVLLDATIPVINKLPAFNEQRWPQSMPHDQLFILRELNDLPTYARLLLTAKSTTLATIKTQRWYPHIKTQTYGSWISKFSDQKHKEVNAVRDRVDILYHEIKYWSNVISEQTIAARRILEIIMKCDHTHLDTKIPLMYQFNDFLPIGSFGSIRNHRSVFKFIELLRDNNSEYQNVTPITKTLINLDLLGKYSNDEMAVFEFYGHSFSVKEVLLDYVFYQYSDVYH